MIVLMEFQAVRMLRDFGAEVTDGRVQKLAHIMMDLDDESLRRLRLETCSDERTGARYGRAKCRAGRCAKIGGGQHGTPYAFQIWAVWP